jgi:hypothetical protein
LYLFYSSKYAKKKICFLLVFAIADLCLTLFCCFEKTPWSIRMPNIFIKSESIQTYSNRDLFTSISERFSIAIIYHWKLLGIHCPLLHRKWLASLHAGHWFRFSSLLSPQSFNPLQRAVFGIHLYELGQRTWSARHGRLPLKTNFIFQNIPNKTKKLTTKISIFITIISTIII